MHSPGNTGVGKMDDSMICEPIDDNGAFDHDVLMDVEETLQHPPGMAPCTKRDSTVMDHTPKRTPHNRDMQIETDLLLIVREIGATLESFQRIMEWARAAHLRGYEFNPTRKTYQTQMKHLEDTMDFHALRPRVEPMVLEGYHSPILSVSFDFKPHLDSLLHDETLNQLTNLVVNPRDRFLPFFPEDRRLSEVLTGSWYQGALQSMITDPNQQFLCPLLLSTDKTHISREADYYSHPVFFTLAIFNRATRNLSEAWRPLGYIHHPKSKRFDSKSAPDRAPMSCRNYHKQMDLILDSLWHAQQPGSWAENYCLILGQKKKNVHIMFPIGPVICDAQGGDELCGRIGYFGEHAVRICRTCDAAPLDCGDPNIPCNRVCMSEVSDAFYADDDQKLRRLYSHKVENAFWRMNMGNDPFGILSLCNTEILHAAKNGYIQHFLIDQFHSLGKRSCTKIDDIVFQLSSLPRQHGAEVFSRLRFKDGITNLTNVTAECKHSILKVFLMALVTERGRKFMVKKSNGVSGWLRLVEVIEMILSFLEWASSDTFWEICDENGISTCAVGEAAAEASLKQMMQGLSDLAPRSKGMGWNITKVHEIKHIAHDISRFGSPSNTHTGPTEHHHIVHAKKPSKTCRKDRFLFDKSVGDRYVDNLIINTCRRAFECVPTTKLSTEPTNCSDVSVSSRGSTRGTLCFWKEATEECTNIEHQQEWHTRSLSVPFLEDDVMDCVAHTVSNHVIPGGEAVCVHAFTEHHRFGVSFRAHSNYQGDGPWQDWVRIRWEGLGDIPAMILCFFEWNNETLAVVHSAEMPSENYSVLVKECSMEPELVVVPTSAFVRHTFVFPHATIEDGLMFEFVPVEEWPEKFTEFGANEQQTP